MRLGRAQPFPWKWRPALGAISAAVTVAITGVAATGSVGTVAPSTTVAASGVAGTGAVGSLPPSTTVGLTGVAGTGQVGTVTVSGGDSGAVVVSLTGVAGTGAVGTVTPSTTVSLTGASGTGAAGTVGTTGGVLEGVSVAITGVSATGAVGNVSLAGGTSLAAIYKGDTGTNDDGELYMAYVKSMAVPPGGSIARLGEAAQIGQPILVARESSGVSLTLTIDRDFGLEEQTSTVDLTAAATETRVIRKFEGAATADATVLQFQVGDATFIASTWSLDALHVSSDEEGDR